MSLTLSVFCSLGFGFLMNALGPFCFFAFLIVFFVERPCVFWSLSWLAFFGNALVFFGLFLVFSLLYRIAMYNSYKESFFCQNGSLSLFYTAAIYNAYHEGTLSVRMEAFLFVYSCHIKLIQGGTLCVRMEASLFCIQLP